jgi:two-component system nitrogen regulation response regulator NtrX
MSAHVLIIDDQDDIRALTQGILNDEGYTTQEAPDAQTAVRIMAEKMPDAVVLDIWLEDSEMDGMALLKKLSKSHPGVPVIMISGHGNIETAVSAIQLGAYDFIEKPFNADRLLVLMKRALEAGRLRRENQELRLRALGGAAEFHGHSAMIQQVRQSIERVAPTSSRVLITGRPGTGKDVAARMIHNKSKRANKNYVVLNCAILSPERIEMELFGTEGALGRKQGVLEQANGGTLFLDEVADMPLETQAKIVRVLQDQYFTRLGGSEVIDVDVRVIAASNQNLPELMEREKFRQDLYYRLNIVPIELPSLRERSEDIPVLADYFMNQSALAANVAPRFFAADALALMQSYPWPGNVRQLKNVIEWLLIMAEGEADEPITANMLPPDLKHKVASMVHGQGVVELMSKPLREARDIFEREYLQSQMTRFGGNISKTAVFVGMERSALHRKLKAVGLQANDKETQQDAG